MAAALARHCRWPGLSMRANLGGALLAATAISYCSWTDIFRVFADLSGGDI
jgi:hypothetical protein